MAFNVQHSSQPVAVDSAIDRVVPPWVHFAAGASGGLITAIVTSPLDVLRTRMQSDLYLSASRLRATSTMPLAFRLASSPLRHICETFETIGAIHRTEGWRNFFLAAPRVTPLVHAQAAVAAGIATATATNPIWLVKTRLQLDKKQSRLASYLGTLETVVHLVLYERLKTLFRKGGASASGAASSRHSELSHWASTAAAAGCAKVAAVLITYPHEVFRTRLRQAPAESLGRVQQTSLVQCCRTTWVREGWRGFYAGLTPHLIRSVPSAIITFGVYEFVLRTAGVRS
ncbi:hypothetical protein V2A60_006435 [Cordyceps javanica]